MFDRLQPLAAPARMSVRPAPATIAQQACRLESALRTTLRALALSATRPEDRHRFAETVGRARALSSLLAEAVDGIEDEHAAAVALRTATLLGAEMTALERAAVARLVRAPVTH